MQLRASLRVQFCTVSSETFYVNFFQCIKFCNFKAVNIACNVGKRNCDRNSTYVVIISIFSPLSAVIDLAIATLRRKEQGKRDQKLFLLVASW